MTRRPVQLLSLLLAAITGCSTPPQGPPNILLVVLDTTRADAVSFVEGPVAATPRLAGLAAHGVAFTNARSTSAWTLPAHGSLFTGLYPSRHGAHHESHLLREDAVTLAELLADSHARAGFSENPHIGHQKGFAQGFEVFEETWRGGAGTSSPRTIQRATDWLLNRESKRPFFLFVNLMDPHLPYRPPDHALRQVVTDEAAVQRLNSMQSFGEREARGYITGRLRLTEEDLSALRILYQGEVAYADERLGQLLDAIERDGVLDNTLVVVVGDHGENLGEHRLMEHQLCLYETLLRVPLVLSMPGAFAGGQRRTDSVQLVDVLPTVLDVLGLDRQEWPPIEGVSLTDGGGPGDRPVIAEYMRPLRQRQRFMAVAADFDFDRYDRRLRSIQIGDLKLIVADQGEAELYDLDADPGEENNLATRRIDDVARLRSRLEEWLASRGIEESVADPELDAETLEKLRSLGYVQ